MKSWRMVAVVLLGMQAGMIASTANAAVADDVVNVEDDVAPSAPVLTAEQRIEALIASFNSSLATISSASSVNGRLAGYRGSLTLLDQIRLDRPSFDFKPGLNTFLSNYVDELNLAGKKLSGVERTRNRGETRGVLLRLASPKARVDKLLDIARIEADSSDISELLPTLQSALVDMTLLTSADRDKALLAAVGIVARPGRDVPGDAFYWLANIKDTAQRADALRIIAEAAASRDAKLVELMGSTQIGADRDARLLDISDFMTRKGNWEAATWTAVQASMKNAPERDAALSVVIDDVISSGRGEVHAVHAISDPALRNRKLLDIVSYLLKEQRLADARTMIGYMQPRTESVFAWLRVGQWLQQQEVNRQALDALDKSEAILAALNLPKGELRDRLLGELAELAVNLGQRDRGTKLIAQISNLEFAGAARVAAVKQSITDSMIDRSVEETARLPKGLAREQATVAVIEALARARRWDAIGPLLSGLTQPLLKLDARIFMIKALKRPEDVKPDDPVQPDLAILTKDIEALAATIIKGTSNRSDAFALRAIARAVNGRFSQARVDLQESTSSDRYEDAMSYVASRQTFAEGMDAGMATAELAWKPSQRQKAVSAVALATAERGEIEKATALVRAFTDDRARVETFHKMAKVAARRLDQFGLIDAAAAVAPGVPNPGRLKDMQLLSASDGKQLFAMPNPNLGRILPNVPSLRTHVSSAISGDVPVITPGAIHVLPMEYSDFN